MITAVLSGPLYIHARPTTPSQFWKQAWINQSKICDEALERVDIQDVQMTALIRDSRERKAREVCS
jgi:hypothetical protein